MVPHRDYHVHCALIGCANETMTIPAIMERAADEDISILALTDHLNFPKQVNTHREIRRQLDAQSSPSIEVIFGVEFNYTGQKEGEFPFDESLIADLGFELVIAGIHDSSEKIAGLREMGEAQHRMMMECLKMPCVDVLVHPWWIPASRKRNKALDWPEDLAFLPDEKHAELARAAAEAGIAIEINSSAIFLNGNYSGSFKEDYVRVLKVYAEQGVKFSICSDAHRIGQVGSSRLCMEILRYRCGVPPEQVWHHSERRRASG